jgi:hypothetical protein
MTTVDTKDGLYITGKYSPVHRMRIDPHGGGITCAEGQAATMRKFITPVQAFYYGLPACIRDGCFADVHTYQRIVGMATS